MPDAIAIHGHEIIELVSKHSDGIRLSQLMEMVDERFGKSVTFHTCSAVGMDLDGHFHHRRHHGDCRPGGNFQRR